VTDDPQEAALAELMGLLLQGRPEWITTFLLGSQPPEVRDLAAKIADALAAVAASTKPVVPTLDTAGNDPLKARILASLASRPAPRTALLVIDMQNDTMTPGAANEVPRARDIVPALAARLDAARNAKVPVVYVVDQHDVDDPDLDLWQTHNVVGSKGAEVWPAIAPKPGDHIVTKPTYSAFTRSALDQKLDELAVDSLVLTGCVTEVGVLTTAMDALQRGFAVEIPPDCQAGSGPLPEGVAMATLAMVVPFGPARVKRLESIRAKLGSASV
jgi:nicotinamidase-related amidase